MAPRVARADELKYSLSGKVQSDLRFRLQDLSVGDFYDKATLAAGIERNQNLLSVKFKASYGAFATVVSTDLYLNAVGAKLQSFSDLQRYNAVQPVSLEPQQMYVEGKNLILPGLDLRIGNQIIAWGVADQFNPTNNLNSDDLRDPLLFGKQQPNFMVRLDYWINKNFNLSGVLVPLFKPALLPASASLGSVDIQRMPFVSDAFRHRVESQFAYAGSNDIGYPTVVNKLTPVLPTTTADNMQLSYRIAGTIGEQDLALSYYLGRTDFPQAFSNHTRQADGMRCDPAKPTRCINGTLKTDVLLGYPRMHVWGLNASGEFNPFKKISEAIHGIGYRVEAAVIVPTRADIALTQDALPALLQSAGPYDYAGLTAVNMPGAGHAPAVVDSTPFLKWTLSLDYTFGAHVYTNVMWVHGLADEYGAGDFFHAGWSVKQSGVQNPLRDPTQPMPPNGSFGSVLSSLCVVSTPRDGSKCASETLAPRLGDYLVAGADFKFLDDAGLFRLFTIWSLSGVTMDAWDIKTQKRTQTHHGIETKEGFSASIYPEVTYNFGNGLELGVGGLVLLGRSYTKFGDPAAGGSLAFTRARFSF